jgi:hypothetical protein
MFASALQWAEKKIYRRQPERDLLQSLGAPAASLLRKVHPSVFFMMGQNASESSQSSREAAPFV